MIRLAIGSSGALFMIQSNRRGDIPFFRFSLGRFVKKKLAQKLRKGLIRLETILSIFVFNCRKGLKDHQPPTLKPIISPDISDKNISITILFSVVEKSSNNVLKDDNPRLTSLRARVVYYAPGAFYVFSGKSDYINFRRESLD